MRGTLRLRRASGGVRVIAAGLVLTGAALVGSGAVAGAQTTTVPPIPITGGATTTTTVAAGAGDDLASTGVAADLLVPFGFALIGVGGVLQVASRRPRRDLGLL